VAPEPLGKGGNFLKKRIIWTNEVDTSDEAITEFRNSLENGADYTDNTIIEMMYDDNQIWLEDEQANLDITTSRKILCIGDLGLWWGRRPGYRILNTQNVKSIFSVTCGDYVEFYADSYNVHCSDAHHDGTNYYMFRELRCNEDQCQPLLDAICSGKIISSALLNRYTRSILPYVADVYGWPVSGRKRNA